MDLSSSNTTYALDINLISETTPLSNNESVCGFSKDNSVILAYSYSTKKILIYRLQADKSFTKVSLDDGIQASYFSVRKCYIYELSTSLYKVILPGSSYSNQGWKGLILSFEIQLSNSIKQNTQIMFLDSDAYTSTLIEQTKQLVIGIENKIMEINGKWEIDFDKHQNATIEQIIPLVGSSQQYQFYLVLNLYNQTQYPKSYTGTIFMKVTQNEQPIQLQIDRYYYKKVSISTDNQLIGVQTDVTYPPQEIVLNRNLQLLEYQFNAKVGDQYQRYQFHQFSKVPGYIFVKNQEGFICYCPFSYTSNFISLIADSCNCFKIYQNLYMNLRSYELFYTPNEHYLICRRNAYFLSDFEGRTQEDQLFFPNSYRNLTEQLYYYSYYLQTQDGQFIEIAKQENQSPLFKYQVQKIQIQDINELEQEDTTEQPQQQQQNPQKVPDQEYTQEQPQQQELPQQTQEAIIEPQQVIIQPQNDQPSPGNDQTDTESIGLIIGAIAGVVVILIITGILLFRYFRKRRLQKSDNSVPISSSNDIIKPDEQKAQEVPVPVESKVPIDSKVPNSKVRDECCICLQTGCDSVLPCRHYYHLKCIKFWLKSRYNRCPMCQRVTDASKIRMVLRIN